ncbi:FadR/GntR family transcriptional regulator [Pelagibacterium halotolerans]|uniref:FadR/GntR family transcriptional regulator n=1 Tax=Pelagibacterium halotolerans TaxID=531813 RepID=UPI0038506AFB
MSNGAPRRVETLSKRIGDELRQAILAGKYRPGDKLPSEAQLTEAHNVSRTVVREAIAQLRLDGLVEAYQGAGVFVLDRAATMPTETARLASTLEILEVRTPLEVAAAGLAALRRSPSQEERILNCHADMFNLVEEGGDSFREADFRLHLAIAEATNNAQFTDVISRIGVNLVPQSHLSPISDDATRRGYRDLVMSEHDAIVRAISNGDRDGAEKAMHNHLVGSQDRHRTLLHSHRLAPAGKSHPM